MWSISKGLSSHSWDNWQYSQQSSARFQTSRINAASMSVSGVGAFLGFDAERSAGLGFEDGEQVSGLAEGEQLFLLGGR